MGLPIVSTVLFVLAARLLLAQESAHVPSSTFTTLPPTSTASIAYSPARKRETEYDGWGDILEVSSNGLKSVAPNSSIAIVSSSIQSSAAHSLVGITGASSTNTLNATGASTSTPRPSNTRPCNGYVELCDRKLSNISMVVAHNSPFVVPHNAASNQVYPVLNQLADGVRGLQFETHYPNATAGLSLCHTSCDLLDVGPLSTYLTTIRTWLETHPYEVIAIMMGNDDRVPPTTYIQPFQDAGLLPYLYEPTAPNATLAEWPTLSQMILTNKRVVVMLDYLANQTQVPWLLDEFDYQWQTPFSPTNRSFPCTEQRPPNQPDDVSRDKMYMLNHNLNIEVNLLGMEILIPAYTLLDQVNAVSGNASLGLNVQDCAAMWGRPPNWLLVDYYNFGNFNGSVFEVAAEANGVQYQRGRCCGSPVASGGDRIKGNELGMIVFAVVSYGLWLW